MRKKLMIVAFVWAAVLYSGSQLVSAGEEPGYCCSQGSQCSGSEICCPKACWLMFQWPGTCTEVGAGEKCPEEM